MPNPVTEYRMGTKQALKRSPGLSDLHDSGSMFCGRWNTVRILSRERKIGLFTLGILNFRQTAPA